MPIELTRGGAILVACVGCNAVAGLDSLHFENQVASSVTTSGAGATASSGGGDGGSAGHGIGGMGGGTSAYVAEVMADAPVAYWRLGEASGLMAADATGNGYDGVYLGGATLGAPGAIPGDTAVSLDGIDGKVSMGDVLDFPNGAPFTLEALVKPAVLPVSPVEFGICGKRGSSPQGTQGFLLRIREDGAPELRIWRDNVEDGANATLALPLDAYTHVVGTFDGTLLQIYVDGLAAEATPTTMTLADAPTDFDIGHDAVTDYMNGNIDEVAVYDHVLTDQRVLAHFVASQ